MKFTCMNCNLVVTQVDSNSGKLLPEYCEKSNDRLHLMSSPWAFELTNIPAPAAAALAEAWKNSKRRKHE